MVYSLPTGTLYNTLRREPKRTGEPTPLPPIPSVLPDGRTSTMNLLGPVVKRGLSLRPGLLSLRRASLPLACRQRVMAQAPSRSFCYDVAMLEQEENDQNVQVSASGRPQSRMVCSSPSPLGVPSP